MNVLPSILIAATLTGSCLIPQGNLSDLQQQIKENCFESQVIIIGNDCLRPSLPDTNLPEVEAPDTETPDTETPDIEAPDTNLPDAEAPDVNIPSEKPEVTPPSDHIPGEDETVKSYAEQVVDLVNAERAKVNLPALTMSEDLNNAAQVRAVETTKSFSHTRPNGSSFSTVLAENNISYRGAGENIAWGQKTPEAVVNAWMNSDGHRANILNKKFTTIGVGYYVNNGRPYWTQLFTY